MPECNSTYSGTPQPVNFSNICKECFASLIPLYERDQRSYLSIGIGCTGGRHRSVTMAIRLQEQFAALGYDVSITHRDLQKP